MINLTYNHNLNRHQKSQNFRGSFEIATQALNLLNESPAVGATLVDVGSMALPRTLVDSKRGVNAGIETGIRETSGSVNHALIGTYGLIGTLIAANLVNKKYGIKAKHIQADTQSVNLYSDMWQDFVSKSKKVDDNVKLRTNFIGYVLENTRAFDNNSTGSDNWKKIPQEALTKAQKIVEKSIQKDANGYQLEKQERKSLSALITSYMGTEQNYKLKFEEREIPATLNSIIDDSFALSKTFTTEKIKPLYINQNKKAISAFLTNISKYKGLSTVIGLGIGSAVGASVQPINRYLTKKRTGQDGFVGVNHTNKSENNTMFKVYKGLAVGAMGLLIYGALGKNVSAAARRVQFKGLMPTIDQFRLVYGITIMSRFMAARDTNELRESTFKDFLGYTNWLILGGFVSKLVAKKINPDLIDYKKQNKGKNSLIDWLKNSNLKTQNEILLADAQKAKVEIFKNDKLRPFKDILKDTVKKVPEVKAKIRGVNIAQIAGLAYSGIVLGWAIPKINIAVTKKINEEAKHPKTIEELHAERLRMH